MLIFLDRDLFYELMRIYPEHGSQSLAGGKQRSRHRLTRTAITATVCVRAHAGDGASRIVL